MTISNREATAAYLEARNNMQNTRPGALARLADRMASDAFDNRPDEGFNPLTTDAMMDIETAIFVGLCRANSVNWRLVAA